MTDSELDYLPHLQCVLDFEGQIKQVNTAWQQLGIMAEHLLVTTFVHWVAPDDLPHTQDSLSQLYEGKIDRIVLENRLRDISGKYRWFIWIMTASQIDSLVYVAGLEVTARAQYEIYLGNHEQRYQNIINALHEGVLVYDVQGKINFCNPRVEQILGLPAKQLLGRRGWDLVTVHEDGSDFNRELQPTALTLRTGNAYYDEIMGIYKVDNSFIWLSINSQPLPLPSNIYSDAVVTTLTDISQRRQQSEECLRENVTLLSSIFKAIPIGLAIIDEVGCFVRANPTFCDIYGYEPNELFGQSFTMLLPPSVSQEEAIQSHVNFLAGKAERNKEQWSTYHRNGQLIYYPITEIKVIGNDGKPFKVIVVTQLENPKTEESHCKIIDLKENEIWLRRLFRQIQVTVLAIDRQGCLTFAEGQYLTMLGLGSEKAVGQSIFEVSQRLEPILPDLQRALNGETFNKFIVYAGVSFKTKYMPLLKDNEWVGTLIVFQDLSEQKILKTRLEKTLQEVELLASYTSLGLMYLEQQKIIRVNQQCATLLGYNQTDLLRTSADCLFRSSEDFIHFQQQIGIYLAKSEPYHTQQWLHKKNGTYVHCKLTVKALNQSNRVLWLLEELHEPEQNPTCSLQAALWATTSEAILVIDAQLKIQQANPASTHLTGYNPEELMTKSLQDLNTGQQDEQFYREIIMSMNQQGQWQGGIWQRHKNNAVYLCELKLQAFDPGEGAANRYVAILSNKQTNDSAFFDPLTNLPSRQLFRHKLLKTHAQAQRNKKTFAILLIGIDDMAILNAQYGCAIGDQFLYQVGQNLKSLVRDSDTVARYGGDVFSVNLSEIAQPLDAGLVSQMILFKLTQPYILKEKRIQGSVSIGIIVFPDDGYEVDALLELAEEAMHKAKQKGGNQCYFHNITLQQQYS